MRVLVTGGTTFSDWGLLCDTLGRLHDEHEISLLIHGASVGTDSLADYWAKLRGVESISCPPDWERYGRGGGSVRNRQMLSDQKSDLMVAFPGDSGTRHMVDIAKKAGIEVILVSPDE